jgi:CheY-like chemotaxis protein
MRAYFLIVERDLLTREVITKLVMGLGHVALGASSPARGLRMLEAMKFDAMIIGADATLLEAPNYAIDAKQLQPQIAVIMTAAIELPEFCNPPIDAFIRKPFSTALLEETLKKLFICSDL